MTIEEELEEMDRLISNKQVTATEPPGTTSPVTEGTSTESPSTESVATDAPTTDAPVEKPDELSSLKDEVRGLKALLEKKPAESPAPIIETPLTLEEINLVNDIDLDELTRDPSALNKLLNSVLLKGVELARKEIANSKSDILKSLPDTVKQNIEVVQTLRKASDDFYAENKDLKPFKKVVSVVFDEIMSKDPNTTYDKILKDVEKEVRVRLELPRKIAKDDQKPPNLPKRKGQTRSPQSTETDPFADEIAAMEKALNI